MELNRPEFINIVKKDFQQRVQIILSRTNIVTIKEEMKLIISDRFLTKNTKIKLLYGILLFN